MNYKWTAYLSLMLCVVSPADGAWNLSNETMAQLESGKSITGCLPFANASGVHKIDAPGLNAFDVLCDNETAGSGWTVIQRRSYITSQQRILDREDFYRNWTTYREGFGSFDGDFFLGLEKLHRLTANQQHELYIQLQDFDMKPNYAHYTHFVIAGEDEQYKLSSLGNFSGTARNDFIWHLNMKFSTFDRDNDLWKNGNCAERSHGGWWYHMCASCNLNGRYFNVQVNDPQAIYWDDLISLMNVKMLIRPNIDGN